MSFEKVFPRPEGWCVGGCAFECRKMAESVYGTLGEMVRFFLIFFLYVNMRLGCINIGVSL